MAEVDPRFDPQFQRGYDPAKHGRPARRPDPVVEPVETHLESVVEPVETRPERLASTSSTTGSATGSAPEPDLDPPRRNPFRLILLLASLAGIAGSGLLLWQRIAQDPYGGYGGYGGDLGKVFLQQLTDSLMVPLLTAGLLGLCLWLALGALRGRR